MKKNTKDTANMQLVAEVQKDFENRKAARRAYELQWQLNIDFLRGNQNNYITKFDTVVPMGKQFYWQNAEVYNHISTMVEARLGKLSVYKHSINVLPITSDKLDYQRAETCKKIVESVFAKVNIEALMERCLLWAEMTGTAFYKTIWDRNTGDIKVVVCSPFEIYPDQLTAENINECRSIIHAKVYSIAEIERIWGVVVAGQEQDVFDLSGVNGGKRSRKTVMENAAVVIERYERPSVSYPNGQLVIVAGDKLLYKGDLPYVNQLPFVRQCAELAAGCFYGKCAVERAIPVQRAYNSVKNRKSEFLNRLACGVLSVEEGSVDLESLENDGLAPGKVIVYRQGMQAPKFIDTGSMPAELEREEERLLREFSTISGSVDFTRDSEGGNLSGVALRIMVDEENKRMTRAVNQIMRSIAEVGSQILRLCKQFAPEQGRVERVISDGTVQNFHWTAADITTDEVTVTSSGNVSAEANVMV